MRVNSYEVIGHRGHGSRPENTMGAFQKGHELGADRIEFDIQKDKDGDYVVIHDPTVDRTTDGTGKVADLTTAQIKALKTGEGEPLPLFSEVVDWAVQNDVALDIEVKHPHPGDEHELAQLVKDSGLRDPWVMSFNGAFVERFEDCAPEVTTGILVHERPLFDKAVLGAKVGAVAGLTAALASSVSALPFVGIVAGGILAGAATGYGLTMHSLRRKDLQRDVDVHIPGKRILSKNVVEKAHSMGKEVAVYTIDDPKKGRKFLDWGVDALISNYPERHF